MRLATAIRPAPGDRPRLCRAGSPGGLVATDPAGTFVYADSGGNAFAFAAGAVSAETVI